MKVTEIKGNKVTLELSDKEHDALFRAGLQFLLDKWFGKKVVVLPVVGFKITKKTKKIEVDDTFSLFCVETSVNQALREYIDERKYEIIEKKVK